MIFLFHWTIKQQLRERLRNKGKQRREKMSANKGTDDMWTTSVQQMKDAILGDNNMRSFFEEFEPKEGEGFAWTQDPQYKRYAAILDDKTGRIHSGSSFAVCLRSVLYEIETERAVNQGDIKVVQGEPVSEGGSSVSSVSGDSEGAEEIQVVTPIESNQ